MVSRKKQAPFLMISTAGSRREAERLARHLVQKQLAACVNVIYPVTSFFRWKGKSTKAKEAILVLKTTRRAARQVESEIIKHHSYQVPEIIGFSIQKGSRPYLDWIQDVVRV